MDFIPKPVEANPAMAVQFYPDIIQELMLWIDANAFKSEPFMNTGATVFSFQHPRGTVSLFPGDYLIKTHSGSVYAAEPGPFFEMFQFDTKKESGE